MTTPSPTDTLAGDRLRDALALTQVTADIIADQGIPIQLLRYAAPVADEEGGYGSTSPTADPEPQPVTNRLFMYSLYEPQYAGGSSTGYGTHERFVLVGMPDDDIRINDVFWIGGHRYQIAMLHPDRTYETKAEGEGVFNGSDPS
jgi:hypothetical protein